MYVHMHMDSLIESPGAGVSSKSMIVPKSNLVRPRNLLGFLTEHRHGVTYRTMDSPQSASCAIIKSHPIMDGDLMEAAS